jgi:HK97 family phage portal protein
VSKLSLFDALNNAASKPSALGSWLGQSISLTTEGFWPQFFSQSGSDSATTVNTAMRLSAVWACVRLIAETIATLPVGLYRKSADGGRETVNGELYTVLHSMPNSMMTAVQFWEAVVSSMLLRGNAYIEIHRSGPVGNQKVIALDFLMPDRIRLKETDSGVIRYFYQPKRGPEREIRSSNMMHIPAFSFDGKVGLSAVAYGAKILGTATAAEDVASNTFKNGMMKTVAFKVDRVLKKDQREEFREYVKTVSGAMNAGKSPVLEQGVSTDEIGINPVDAQLLESRNHSLEEICRWFRVPPWMIGYTGNTSNWGTGLEQQLIGFLTFSLSPWLKRIEQSISKNLLTPAERVNIYAEFSLEGLLRADSSARAEFYAKMTQNGIYTRDDCRVKENLPRVGGNADVLTVQMNLTPIQKLGEKNESATVRASLLSWLNIGEKE